MIMAQTDEPFIRNYGQGMNRVLVLALAVVSVVLLAGCEAEQGSVELHNQSDSHVLWVQGKPERLDLFLRDRTSFTTVAPGTISRRDSSFGANPPDWCDEPEMVNFLLRPIDGQPLVSGETVSVSLDSFEIVAERGPGFCWGDKNSSWIFDGG